MWWKEEGTGELNVLVKEAAVMGSSFEPKEERDQGMLINGERRAQGSLVTEVW